jgi:hypothetical protein
MEFHDSDQSCSPCAAKRVPLNARKKSPGRKSPGRSPKRYKSGHCRSPGKNRQYKSAWVRVLCKTKEGNLFSYKGQKYRKGSGITATRV